ncbi:MAG TPA: TfoX/Sxy family protein [Dehalococcoidia bacterium]|nr:TfoX/Sxy family protein [Dehalococcoidia bacterium]
MAYDERLAERVRAALAGRKGIAERKMFGGLAFLLDGKMCIGVLNDELVVRAGAERYAAALKSAHARPMDFTGRPMTGMVYVAPAGVTRGPALRRWIEMGLAGADGATPSKRARKSTAKKAR